MTADDIRRLCDQVYDVLMLSETPPHAQGGGSGQAGSRPPAPIALIDARAALKATLVSWALLISEEAEVIIDCDDEAMSIAGWIYTKADWLAEHPAADDFHTEITEHIVTIRRMYLPRTDTRRWLGKHQGADVYARPGQTEVVLPDGTVERVETLRNRQAARLWDHVGQASEVADIVRIWFGMDLDTKKLHTIVSNDRKRARIGGLVPVDEHPTTYRVSDVVERLMASRKRSANVV